jgi:outer membrane immunogenic protein
MLAGVGTAVFMAAGSTAMAADIAPEPESAADWTGFYVGAGGGYGAALHDGQSVADGFVRINPEGEKSEDFAINFFLLDQFDDLGDVAGLVTVQGGFDFQLGSSLVAGIFGDFTWTGFESKSSAVSETATEAQEFEVSSFTRIEVDDMWTVGGRLGFLSSEDTLWYALGGYTRASIDARHRLELDAEEVEPQGGTGFVDLEEGDKDSVDGFTVGAGVESRLWESFSLRLEYRYTDLGNFGFSYAEGDFSDGEIIGGGAEIDVKFDTTIHSIRGVLSWRFDFL